MYISVLIRIICYLFQDQGVQGNPPAANSWLGSATARAQGLPDYSGVGVQQMVQQCAPCCPGEGNVLKNISGGFSSIKKQILPHIL